MSAAPAAATSMPARRCLPALRSARFRRAGARRRRRQCARLAPHPRGRAEPRADRADSAAPARRTDRSPDRHRGAATAGNDRKGSGSSKDSAATCWSGYGSMATGSHAAICATRHGSSGRCSKLPSKATSSPTSRSATNRSTVRIPDTISRCAEPCSKASRAARSPKRRRTPTTRRLRNWRRSSIGRRGAGSAAASSIREVDAGSCNGCELEIHALNNAFYDLERFGLRFVASPRHADVLMVTGPVTKNMREALERTYDATPDPKWVVAVGDCAVRRRHLCRQLRRRRRRRQRRAGRSAYPRLSAATPRTCSRGCSPCCNSWRAVAQLRRPLSRSSMRRLLPPS